jgi:Helix-turn-helix.
LKRAELMRLAIKELREKAGLTIEELAEKAEVEKDFLIDLEDNKVDVCSAKVLSRIADSLGVKVSYIFID